MRSKIEKSTEGLYWQELYFRISVISHIYAKIKSSQMKMFYSNLLTIKDSDCLFHISIVHSSWQDLPHNSQMFDLVTFNLFWEVVNIKFILGVLASFLTFFFFAWF